MVVEPKQVALAFADTINHHDMSRICSLMAPDHGFIDTYGGREDREAMLRGWPGYFEWFPDYRIEICDVLESGGTVGLFGFAGGTYRGEKTLSGKTAWRVVVEMQNREGLAGVLRFQDSL